MKQGYFISFEGIDGSGKSTMAELLDEHLQGLGRETLMTREPGASPLGRKIRKILLLDADVHMEVQEKALLFAADRVAHVREIIAPALEAGKIVLCDRYIDSTLAYQGGGGGLDEVFLRHLNDFASLGLKPDLTFYFHLPLDVAYKRLRKSKGRSKDNMEWEDGDFFARIDNVYQRLAAEEASRIRMINGDQMRKSVLKEMLSCLPEELR